LVTGGSRGIGRGIAEVMGQLGSRAAETGGVALSLDVTDPNSVDASIVSITRDLSGLDILVNNAGVYRDHGGPIVDLEPKVWR
jgi:NAD(P)-dependent dehydrogenase (short-subunit alcohol dehydrogenase family)